MQAYPNYYSACNITPVSTAAHTDYAANSGTQGPNWWGAPSSGDPSFADAPGYTFPTFGYDGVMNCLALPKMASITDGASNTYLLGEKYLIPDHYFDGMEGTDNDPVYSGIDWDWHRWSTTAPKQDTPGLSDFYCFESSTCQPNQPWRSAMARCARFRSASIRPRISISAAATTAICSTGSKY